MITAEQKQLVRDIVATGRQIQALNRALEHELELFGLLIEHFEANPVIALLLLLQLSQVIDQIKLELDALRRNLFVDVVSLALTLEPTVPETASA